MQDKIKKITFYILLTLELIIAALAFYCSRMRMDYNYLFITVPVMTILTIILAVMLYLKKPDTVISSMLFLITIAVLIFTYRIYSALDEAQHFHMIDFISQNHRLPGFYDPFITDRLSMVAPNVDDYTANYEAMQTPLFYYLFYLLLLPIRDIVTKFYTARVLIGVMGLINLIILTLVINLSEKKGYTHLKGSKYYIIACIAVSPLYTEIFSHISNDAPMALIATVIYSVLIIYTGKATDSDPGTDAGYLLSLIALSVILFYTKMSAIPVLFSVFLFLILYKKVRATVIYSVPTGLACAPWFIVNKIRYDSFTGSAFHLNLILPWAFPSGERVTFFDMLYRMPAEFAKAFTGLEVVNAEVFYGYDYIYVLACCILVFLLSAICYSTVILVKKIISAASIFDLSAADKLLFVSLSAIYAEVILLIYESIASGFDIQNNRAFAPYFIPFMIIFSYLLNAISNESGKLLKPIGSLTVALLISNMFFASITSVPQQYLTWERRDDYKVLMSRSVSIPGEEVDVSILSEDGRNIKKHPLMGGYLRFHADVAGDTVLSEDTPPAIDRIIFHDDDWKYDRQYFPMGSLTDDRGIIVYIPDDVRSPESVTLTLRGCEGISEMTVEYIY